MVLGEFGPIFSDMLFTQTARNRTINIDNADSTRVRLHLVGDFPSCFFQMGCYNQYKARGCSYTECKSQHMLHTLALWGLVTNYGEGGYKTALGGGGGGQVKFYSYKRGGRGKTF